MPVPVPVDVMIVDDSAAIRKILLRILIQADVPVGNVIEAGDGREALAKLEGATVGLIFTDIQMPNMGGLELLAALKAQPLTRDVPVLMVTAAGRGWQAAEAMALGAAGCLVKPFIASDISQTLEGLIQPFPAGKSYIKEL